MAKITLPTIESGYLSAEAINEAFRDIEDAINNTLSRDGTTPNQMEADIDLNGHTILNSGAASDDPDRVMTYEEVSDLVADHASGLIVVRVERQTATAGQTLFTLASLTYTPDVGNLAVYVDGVRKFTTHDFTEDSETEITFGDALIGGEAVDFVASEYTATIAVDTHTHPWSELTNLPDYATRWPAWGEVTGKPTVFAPDDHEHDAGDITSGRLADARRGVYVQATQPTANTVGELWIW